MQLPKHTPGPWEVLPVFDEPFAIVARGNSVATLQWELCEDREKANAALIAAAPELLAACQEFVRKVDEGTARSTRSYEQMKAAIAKATSYTGEEV